MCCFDRIIPNDMKRIAIVLFLSLTTLIAWADVSFQARVQGGNTVEAGTRFQVEYELGSTCDNFDCDLSTVSGIRVVSGPFSSSYMSRSIVNGKSSVSNTTTYTYVLIAEKEGSYTLPAAKATTGGKTYASNSITLNVLPADPNNKQAQSSSSRRQSSSSSSSNATEIGKNDVLLAIDLSKTSVYEGEALMATMNLYFRNFNVANIQDAKFPGLEGFTVQEIELDPNRQTTTVQYKGGNYRVYPIRQWLLFPQHSGEIKINTSSLTAIAQVYTGRRSFWDDPFNVYQNVQVPVTSPERVVKVNTLPSGKPASYMNAVGEFTIGSEMTANKVKANDALIYRVTINGTGNLKYVREPKPEFPADFEVYDPKSDLQSRTTTSGISGKKVIEYTIIPRFGGTFTIPSVEFTYFSTNKGKYVTLKTEAYTLEVEKSTTDAQTGTGSVDFSGTTQERIKVLGSDIRYIHNIDPDSLEEDDEPMYGTTGYWLWFLLPSIAFAVLLFIYRRELKLRADVAGLRTRKANKVATKRLKSAAEFLKQHQTSAFYEAVHKAMLGYVADKLSMPLSEMTGDSIREELAKRNVDEDLIKRCAEVLSTCEFARYAPSSDDNAMDKLYEEASETIDQLERTL